MYTNSYTADGSAMANLIATNIYNEVSSIAELVADYYDADATKVDISLDFFKDDIVSFINQITITGDGHGMTKHALANLMHLGTSNKSNTRSPKFKRLLLGSFGIAFASIQRLGNSVDIYTRCSENNRNEVYHTTLTKNEEDKLIFSSIEIIPDENHYLVPYETGTTLVVKQCNIPDFIFSGKLSYPKTNPFDYLQSKLALLPISDNFSVTLQDIPVSKLSLPTTCYDVNTALKNTSIIEITHSDTDYLYFPAYINILEHTLPFHIYFKSKSSGEPFSIYERGIRLSIHDRLIDYNYLEDIKGSIPSPGGYSTRLLGIIPADILFKFMNASRNGLINSEIQFLLCKQLAYASSVFINKVKAYYETPFPNTKKLPSYSNNNNNNNNNNSPSTTPKAENTRSHFKDKHKRKYQSEQRKEFSRNRRNTPNTKLLHLGIAFHYSPNNEMETFCLISQMSQLKLLPFNLLECSPHSYPDCIVTYEMSDNKLGFMEVEYSLGNFFYHGHSIYEIDMICCWQINHTHLSNEVAKYLPAHTEILSINLVESSESPYITKLVCSLDTKEDIEIEVIVLSKLIENL